MSQATTTGSGDRAAEIWSEYERTHDLRGKEHLAVGIDSDTGEIHFGASMEEIVERLDREGRFKPLFYRWVNDASYYHAGARR